MQSIFSEFSLDLDDIVGVVNLLAKLEQKKNLNCTTDEKSEFELQFIEVQNLYKDSSKGINKIPGTIVPYVAGRFEIFVKTIFEETATQVAKIHPMFKKLPSEFQSSLIEDTSKVIADPRKFQHGEGARDSFIKNLHNNIHNNDLSTINYQCISTTERNMKANILGELFKKISYKRIWEDIAAQANIRFYFDGQEPSKVKSDCEKKLNDFMSKRNGIAHPSNDVTWLSISEFIDYIEFLKELGAAISSVCPLFVKQKEKQQTVSLIQ
ncbi:HEPN domain-containing protein [Labilibacter marinus]|uniref:HEPN domain-containing protein n=1 Tax=Labilibacter marinus TaxID=1477105 RepID=UPI00094F6855|nr:HEPN domain-containing protein [Labilibacter marinus]